MKLGVAGGQTRTFIAGIRGSTTEVMDAVTVVIDSAGQLGTVNSSRRFKKEIADIGEASAGLLELRPVTFRYEREPSAGESPLGYGLVAEDVREVFPDLVALDPESVPETVLYRLLTPMLLNEVQRLHRITEELQREVERLGSQADRPKDLSRRRRQSTAGEKWELEAVDRRK